MAISSTTPTMVRVATMWIGQEKGRLPKSSRRAALRACSTHTHTTKGHTNDAQPKSEYRFRAKYKCSRRSEAVRLLLCCLPVCKQEVSKNLFMGEKKPELFSALERRMKSRNSTLTGKWMSGTVSKTDSRMASRTVITIMS